MAGMTRMVHDDPEAGLRFVVPPGWEVTTAELVEPLTTAVYPGRGRSAEQEAAEAERALWEEAMSYPGSHEPRVPVWPGDLVPHDDLVPPDDLVPHGDLVPPDDDDPEAFVVDLLFPRAIYLGSWEGLDEPPPDEEDLLHAADWLATGLREDFRIYPPHALRGLDHGQRRVTVADRPAAVVWYRFLPVKGEWTDDGDVEVGYLRLLLVHLGADAPAFVVGLGRSRADRRTIDACLDSVTPLVDGRS